ncbi:MAG: MBL fold metallo-hydrolase [Sediminibacterium sp.]|nr:MBL fold metallo-hydrolase [Sediminibacterium sp.]
MIHIKKFTFNIFQEHTFILYNEHKNAIIIDPGFQNSQEEELFFDFLNKNNLTPIYLLNTHCHIDHVLGNQKIYKIYNLPLHIHKNEQVVLNFCTQAANMFNIQYDVFLGEIKFIDKHTLINLNDDLFTILELPGHSPGSIGFYNQNQSFIISGDVLFKESIGRTDLPLGNFDVLMHSINQNLFNLPDDTLIYAGHGSITTIEFEKKNNPFLK